MIKIEEVKLNGVDLGSLNLQSEKIEIESKNMVKPKSPKKKLVLKNKSKQHQQVLFLKILFFQLVVSGFVLAVLFSIKKIYPNKFKTISAQLNLAINEGPKFYEEVSSKINEFNRNFNLRNSSNKIKVYDKNVSACEMPMNKKVKSKNGYVKNNCGHKGLNLQKCLNLQKNRGGNEVVVASEKTVVDDLENISQDDGDVYFYEFVPPIRSGRVSSKFGTRINPLTKKETDFHRGVDIVSAVGTPISAVADGRVLRAAYSQKSGNFIIITHGNGYESRYAHCSKLLKKAGDEVKKGEKIALVGNTGDTTGAHLHVGFRKDGNWIDPKVLYPNYG